MRRVKLAPSILSADFARMGEECRAVLGAGGDLLHLDVRDGHSVPFLTMGPDLCRCLRRALPAAFLDVHLMVTDPGADVRPFVAAGANHITFHIEVAPGQKARDLAAHIRDEGATAGIAINPPTAAGAIADVVDAVDLVLVMSVNPGFSGQKFIEEVLGKTRWARERLRPDQRLEMDGGIGLETIGRVRDAGCDVVVAATAIFGVPELSRSQVIQSLRGR